MNFLSKCALGTLMAAAISYNANATFSLQLHNEFSGGQQPLGILSVDFTNDPVLADTVNLTVSYSSPAASEFVSQLYLNLDPTLNPLSLDFDQTGSTGTFGAISVLTGANAFKADGDGLYDILLDFDTAPPIDRFNTGDSVTFQITGITGLNENSFDFLSAPDGGHGPFKAAAHIQGVGPDANGSGFIAPGVPDGGTTIMLLGTAFACLGAMRRYFP